MYSNLNIIKMAKLTMTKKTFISRIIITLGLILILAYTLNVKFIFDTGNTADLNFGSIHIVFNLLMVAAIAVIGINALHESLTDGKWSFLSEKEAKERREQALEDGGKEPIFDFSFTVSTWRLIWVGIFLGLIYFSSNTYTKTKFIYNKSVIYNNDYTQTVQLKQGFYENLWNSFLEQKMITSLNKDAFIEVSKIIMENRKDGDKLAWKWVQETQQIPFSEFTTFYANLSDFIASKRDEYLKIEMKCQSIANQNNTLLDTFPNNVYNKLINRKRINFEYGFAGEKKTTIFTSKAK